MLGLTRKSSETGQRAGEPGSPRATRELTRRPQPARPDRQGAGRQPGGRRGSLSSLCPRRGCFSQTRPPAPCSEQPRSPPAGLQPPNRQEAGADPGGGPADTCAAARWPSVTPAGPHPQPDGLCSPPCLSKPWAGPRGAHDGGGLGLAGKARSCCVRGGLTLPGPGVPPGGRAPVPPGRGGSSVLPVGPRWHLFYPVAIIIVCLLDHPFLWGQGCL